MPPLPPAGPEPPADRDLLKLVPQFRQMVQTFLIEAARQGIALRVTEAFRSRQRQEWLYSLGRTHCHPQTLSDAIVTMAEPGSSKHEDGLAVDVVPMLANMPAPGADVPPLKAIAWWNCPFWPQIGAIGESVGLRWGGKFKTLKDRPHFEM